jgi:hypothetical protein
MGALDAGRGSKVRGDRDLRRLPSHPGGTSLTSQNRTQAARAFTQPSGGSNGSYHVRAQRSAHYSDADHLVAAERPQGIFSRQLTLGEGVDPDHLAG